MFQGVLLDSKFENVAMRVIELSGARQASFVCFGQYSVPRPVTPERRPDEDMVELAAFICGHVFDQSSPVLLVSHEGGDWQFLCGGYHEAGDTPRVVGINHLFDRDWSLRELLDLPSDWEAERVAVGGPWERRHCP